MENEKFKPTLDNPTSNQAIEHQSNFKKTMNVNQLSEVDNLLNEKEHSLKKKIFNLAKTEALVHSDPKLSSVYNEMAENGEEKYGYHYNETIMNIIFNDYVLNSSQYLQKYKMAIPKKKKRRDKSGINQLKKRGAEIEKKRETMKKEKIEKDQNIKETSSAGSAGGANGYVGYAGPSAWGDGDLIGGKKTKKDKDSFWKNGKVIQESEYLINPKGFKKYFDMLNEEEKINEKSKSKSQQRFMGTVSALQKGDVKPSEVSSKIKKAAKSMSVDDVKDFAKTKHDKLPEKVDETMIDSQDDSMSVKPPIGGQGGGDFPTGLQISKTMSENKENKILNKLNYEISLFETYLNKLKNMNEEKRHSALVLKDRLGKENTKNFKDDLKYSGTKEIIDTTKELEWNDQQTDVPKDPQKLGKDIEKEALKNTKGVAFDNKGDSTNNKGNEIPKRNLTDDEHDEVDLYRKGLGDFVFDNKPPERFEKRMERDMGDKNYKLRQKRMEFNGKAPAYNKDTQPVDDGIKKVQYDKDKSMWNQRMGINEGMMTGKYRDELGNTRFFDFNSIDIMEVKNLKKGAFFKVNLDGLGNGYDSKVNVNENFINVLSRHKFYTDGTKVFALKNPVQNLNENSQTKEKPVVNEEYNKMKHLLGYNPKNYTNTKNIKL